MITFKQKGDYKKLNSYLERIKEGFNLGILDKYGRRGVYELKNATPMLTGKASESWDYRIERKNGNITITWTNNDIENGFNVVIGLQYGHGTKNGGYVEGIDIINPTMQPIFERIANEAWEEVKRI